MIILLSDPPGALYRLLVDTVKMRVIDVGAVWGLYFGRIVPRTSFSQYVGS